MSTDLLARLIEAGTPAALVGEVAMALARAEADVAAAHEPTAGALRMRRYRERHTPSPSVTCDNSDARVTDSVTEPPSQNKETSPRPPKEIKPIPRATNASARGTTLPIGWRPQKLDRDTASGRIIEQRGQDWAKRCLETFENHWRAKAGKDATKRDWQATWANWVIEQDRRDGRNGSGNRQHSVQPSGIGRTAEAALDVFGPGGGGPH